MKIWAELLSDPEGFAFPKENVTQLVGWPEDERKRPTYANIVKGFEALIAKAGPDTQVVIVLAGHGVQIQFRKDRIRSTREIPSRTASMKFSSPLTSAIGPPRMG